MLGPSGSGKSTIVNLLLRFYDPSEGSIFLDGQDLIESPRREVRSQIAVVMQEPFLYSKTLKENILFGRSSAADSEVTQAAMTAAVHEAILEFDAGYDTVVGERGVTLSGGQRQRIALARALLEKPALLILDDALSAVDTETEGMILEALEKRRGEHTTLVVAHRISTLMRADWILVFDRGRVIQQGTHATLARETGLYRKLWKIQSSLEQDFESDLRTASGAVKEED
jgi:ATP-binding cassette subfamily B protein